MTVFQTSKHVYAGGASHPNWASFQVLLLPLQQFAHYMAQNLLCVVLSACELMFPPQRIPPQTPEWHMLPHLLLSFLILIQISKAGPAPAAVVLAAAEQEQQVASCTMAVAVAVVR
eukprot:scaffold17833_cov15-Tisochrysis_lutea.AAC.1